jgi:pimeloyl-ACP methyl ester carboxylesterase
MKRLADLAVNSIIRPPRSTYQIEALPDSIPAPSIPPIPRQAVRFTNSRGHSLLGSFYAIPPSTRCIVYLHGNSSCQSEGAFLVPVFCPAGISVFCFDFGGCGMSEGDYISLGWYERDDVACCLAHLRAAFGIGQFALWGRSMGAATAIYSVVADPTIACAVCDSPFASLPLLFRDLAGQVKVPGCLTPPVVWYLSRRVLDIREVAPVAVAEAATTPIFLIHGENDDFVKPTHARMIFDAWGGAKKELHLVPGAHIDDRPVDVLTVAMLFVAAWMDVPILLNDVAQRVRMAEKTFRRFDKAIQLVGIPDDFVFDETTGTMAPRE